MIVLETKRLIVRRLRTDDAEFILELLNDPDWIRFIGDKGVKNLEEARRYISTGPIEMYERLGFGMYLVWHREREVPIGICGLIRRPGLDAVDIGFALLPRFRKAGYAREAAAAVLEHGRVALGLGTIVAITAPDNEASAGLLETLGFRFTRVVRLSADSREVRLFTAESPAPPGPPAS